MKWDKYATGRQFNRNLGWRKLLLQSRILCHESYGDGCQGISQKFCSILFRYVLCFSGTLDWDYAILRMGSEKEFLQFMAEMHPSGLSDEELRSKNIYGKLFIFESKNHQVRLVADSFNRLESL